MSAFEPTEPVRFIVTDDLQRSRATVLFRLLLVIPAWIVFALWSLAAVLVVIAAWFVILVKGRCSDGIHEFLAAYLRYGTQISAYLYLAANPYPGFMPKPDYPVRVEIAGAAPQRRWTVFFRIFLAIPACLLGAATGGSLNFGAPGRWLSGGGDATGISAFLGWFASLARGRMPRGLRDLAAYGVGYSAQTGAYLLLLTDRYPNSDPRRASQMALPEHPVRLALGGSLTRSRLLVFFRILLALPHLFWFLLWSVPALLAALAGWLVAPFPGRLPLPLHRFLAAYVRYASHLTAFLYLVGGPFPGFVGAAGSYPVDVEIDPPERQGRWGLVFRGILGLPALLVASACGGIVFAVGFLGWFSSLARGRMPEGMTNIGAVSIRYQAQTFAYLLLLTPRYPYAAPALEAAPTEVSGADFPTPPSPAEAV
jgi:hypothetical protein